MTNMEEQTHNEIMRALGHIEGGVEGIIERLDKINGRLDKHDDKIVEHSDFIGTWKGKFAIIAIIVSVGITLVINYFMK